VSVTVGVADAVMVAVALAVGVKVAAAVAVRVGVAVGVGVGFLCFFAEPVSLTFAVALPEVASLVIAMLPKKSAPSLVGANSTVTVIGWLG
jgi:hypothetical protein